MANPSLKSVPSESKPSRKRGAPRTKNPAIPKGIGFLDMALIAFQDNFRKATYMGAIGGGWIPFAVYFLSHYFAAENRWSPAAIMADYGWNRSAVAIIFVAAGLVYSVSTVAGTVSLALESKIKGVCFPLITEGVMVAAPSELWWLSIMALVMLIVINAIGTGVRLARGSTLGAPTPVSEAVA